MAEILNERYEILRTLGEGGQGKAFLARDMEGGGEVVVKELHMGQAADWKALELFERESAILRNLSHPAIPGYVDGFHLDAGARVFLVQEFIQGRSLDALIAAGELYDDAGIREFLAQMLDILAYLQNFSPPVIHRDLKPSNIIRDAQGTYHLVDFGAVQLIVEDDVGGSTIVGSSGFMPPEQLMGRAQPASDIYALGATCVQMACGMEPGDLPMARMKLQFRDLVGLSDALSDVLEKMLEPQLEQRFSDAEAVQAALESGRVEVADAGEASGLAAAQLPEHISEMRRLIANSPVLVPTSDAIIDDEGVLRIELLAAPKIPLMGISIAFVLGCAMTAVGFSAGEFGLCCMGIPLVLATLGYLFYRLLRSFREYVDRLVISAQGIEVESGRRLIGIGEWVMAEPVQIPLFKLRNCYLNTVTEQVRGGKSQTSTTKPGIFFVDGKGREQRFSLESLHGRGRWHWSTEDIQRMGEEARWLFQLTQTQLRALTAGSDFVDEPDGEKVDENWNDEGETVLKIDAVAEPDAQAEEVPDAQAEEVPDNSAWW